MATKSSNLALQYETAKRTLNTLPLSWIVFSVKKKSHTRPITINLFKLLFSASCFLTSVVNCLLRHHFFFFSTCWWQKLSQSLPLIPCLTTTYPQIFLSFTFFYGFGFFALSFNSSLSSNSLHSWGNCVTESHIVLHCLTGRQAFCMCARIICSCTIKHGGSWVWNAWNIKHFRVSEF